MHEWTEKAIAAHNMRVENAIRLKMAQVGDNCIDNYELLTFGGPFNNEDFYVCWCPDGRPYIPKSK